jgi:DNA-binding SARP family transcriptional activator
MTTDLKTSATLFTTGAMRLVIDDREAVLSSRKALAILTYLALQPGRSESRERVAALLWSDSGGEHGRAALRQTLRRLKQDLGPAEELIDADRSTLRLTAPVSVDIVDAIAAAASGAPPALPPGEEPGLGRLFADLLDLDPDFNLWIAVQRERLSAQLVSALEGAIAAETRETQLLALAEALARVDPTHEGACRAAMQAHVALGDTAQAMRTYERLWQVLDEELEVEPSEKTQSLYVAIKQGQARPALGGAPLPAQDLLAPIAIVVEPIHSDLPRTFAYVAPILRDEMIAAISRFRDWLVVDGEQGGPTPPTYRAYFLRITLHGRDDSILVGMRLTDQADNHTVWADRRTATLEGMTRLHQTALRHLAVALNVHLSAPRLQTVRESASPMGRKYELWMQAQALLGEWRAEAEAKAEAILRDLIASTPNFAPALVALAQSINARPIIYPGERRRRERLEESLALTSRAVGLDPLDSRTHLCRSWSHAIAGSHSAALSHLDLALDLNENDPWTIISAALGFAFGGETERARDLVGQAQGFGMRHSRAAQGYIATAAYLIGDYATSVAAAEVAGDAIINLPAWQAASCIRLGDREGAASSMTKFLDLALPAWTGAPHPTPADAIDWFMGCFPIREDEARAGLHAALLAALEEKRRRDQIALPRGSGGSGSK